MKTSSKARYALYLVIDIARHQEAGPVPLREVSLRRDISPKYLEQIAGELSKLGYLESVRGAQGGYLLAQDAEKISAGDIMRAAEGGFLPVSCLDTDADTCPRQGSCSGASGFWAGLQAAVDNYTNSITIAQLAKD
ncbi:AsnC family transcriptional regulator [Betaproteobacteria bacterium]|nr:AsnC family transcriptional regulator [Betaproteobacteria bacterium]